MNRISTQLLFVPVFFVCGLLPAQDEAKKPPTQAQMDEFKEAVDGLGAALKEKSDVDIIHFSKLIGEKFDQGESKAKANSVKSLGRALKRRSREVKTAVVKALGGTSGKALSLLTRELKGGTAKKNVTYMCDVVRSIGKIAEPKGVKTLTDLLRHKDNAVIGQAITALGDYSGKPTKTRKAIVKEILKYYEPTASAVSKSRPNATDKAKYDALYNPYEQTLAALTGQKEIQGAFKWGQWFRKEGSKKKEW